jgi:prolyl-tRNA synthetase
MREKDLEKKLTSKRKNFSKWYNEVVLRAELADYAPVKGCMVIRPYGFAIWENIQKGLDGMIKEAGIKNAYFPLFIPYSFLEKEKEHVEGFSPELAIVTIGGGKKLAEKLIVRPTSETIMYAMFAKWIKSYRDLPLKVNQWCNIVRWEKRTYLFLRTMEFLWQEGHTAHATCEEAEEEAKVRLSMYQKFVEETLAIPVMTGKKSESEKFPGALTTYTFEALMPDKKVLQGGTSHNLGQNFSKPFNIVFQDKKGKLGFVWQTSWGLTTRIIGALVMVHGDDQGLILPPKIAPVQVVIIPIWKTGPKGEVITFVKKLAGMLRKDFRIEVDLREEYTPGWKFNEWELKGVPIRLEIGPEEIKKDEITLVRRDSGENLKIKSENLKGVLRDTLEDVQRSLFEKAQSFLKENTYAVKDYDEFKRVMRKKRGLIEVFWCEDEACEKGIKEETKATTRCLSLDAKEKKGKCIYCGRKASHRWCFAQAY